MNRYDQFIYAAGKPERVRLQLVRVKDFEIQPARSTDIPAIKAIEIECGLSPWTLAAYASELKRSDAVVLTAHSASRDVIGFILGRVPKQANDQAEILNIGTLPLFRNRGIGSGLLNEFRSICLKRRISVIWLEARASNQSAIDFYHLHGFVRRGLRPNFYTDPVEDAELMSLSLV